ncbi:MAG: hypothetical protein GY703_23860, partial [Gammaproteobacteria bacterium]|nr:hypothetical protein [Gammaproteobacteria bacterium]
MDIIYTVESGAIVGEGIPAAPTLTICGDADDMGARIRVLAQTAEHYLVARAKDAADLNARTGFAVGEHSVKGGDSTQAEHDTFADDTGHKWFGATGVVLVASLRYFCEPFMSGTCHALTHKGARAPMDNDFTDPDYAPGLSYADEFCRQWASHYKSLLDHYPSGNPRAKTTRRMFEWPVGGINVRSDIVHNPYFYDSRKTNDAFDNIVRNSVHPDPMWFVGAVEEMHEKIYNDRILNVECVDQHLGECAWDSHHDLRTDTSSLPKTWWWSGGGKVTVNDEHP